MKNANFVGFCTPELYPSGDNGMSCDLIMTSPGHVISSGRFHFWNSPIHGARGWSGLILMIL